MKYEGKLYGKASGEYFPLIESSEDFEKMKSELEAVKKAHKVQVGLYSASNKVIADLQSELESVKAEVEEAIKFKEQYFLAAINAQNKLKQAKAERDELKAFVKEFKEAWEYAGREDNYFYSQAQELLKDK